MKYLVWLIKKQTSLSPKFSYIVILTLASRSDGFLDVFAFIKIIYKTKHENN